MSPIYQEMTNVSTWPCKSGVDPVDSVFQFLNTIESIRNAETNDLEVKD